MKQIKMLGLAALAALMAMAFVGASSAMAESTALCGTDAEVCPAITHVHETSVGKGTLLSSLATIECEVLFLGDVSEEGAPLIIKGHFTYPMEGCKTTSGTLCEVTETSAQATIEVLRTAHELAEVKGTAEVNAHCGSLINCTYDGEGLKGHGLGPLLSSSANGNVNISEQVTHKTGGTFCPKEAKLDLTTTPLSKTYIIKKLLHYCVEYEHANGFYEDSECTTLHPELRGFYELVIAPAGYAVNEHFCVRDIYGLYKGRVSISECKEDDPINPRGGIYELGNIVKIQ